MMTISPPIEIEVHLPSPHVKQREFINSPAKRKIIRAGRRGGKTVGMGIYAVKRFLQGKRILYAVPTSDQAEHFWNTVTRALYEPIKEGIYKKNETNHTIELPGTDQRIRAKTAWNADSMRGDYGDELIFDEWQLMNEDAWGIVGAPMLLDNNGNATFIYTPPSLHSRSTSKANDPQHAAKMFKLFAEREAEGNDRYATFHFTSRDNPHLSLDALDEITADMSNLAYRMEIMAEDVNQAPGALWTRETIDKHRVSKFGDLTRVVVGVDPSATSRGDEAGIVTCGKLGEDYYTIGDDSVQGSPMQWASAAVSAYHRFSADLIVGEGNNGGEMIEAVIRQIDPTVNYRMVHASRGKATRAEPIAAIMEKGHDHHVGVYPELEDELCLWTPGDNSPNRLDAKVWAMTELSKGIETTSIENPLWL
jgi:hypothetical protein